MWLTRKTVVWHGESSGRLLKPAPHSSAQEPALHTSMEEMLPQGSPRICCGLTVCFLALHGSSSSISSDRDYLPPWRKHKCCPCCRATARLTASTRSLRQHRATLTLQRAAGLLLPAQHLLPHPGPAPLLQLCSHSWGPNTFHTRSVPSQPQPTAQGILKDKEVSRPKHQQCYGQRPCGRSAEKREEQGRQGGRSPRGHQARGC